MIDLPGRAMKPQIDQSTELYPYLDGILHTWLRTLALLGITLVPLYYILDYFIVPVELRLTFLAYRLSATALMIVDLVLIIKTRSSRFSVVHGYFISLLLGSIISWMSVLLGGFDSAYYAGLNLVIIGVNLLLPWGVLKSIISVSIIIGSYLLMNLLVPQPFDTKSLINNLFFLVATGVISVAINSVRYKLLIDEFHMRSALKVARDALWGEMQVARKIQESLLPENRRIGNYSISALMVPAEEVGGDYYDFFETDAGEHWVAIGDVSGHGVESGLIAMMTQTGIQTLLNKKAGYSPAELLSEVNSVIKRNINRLHVDRFMTILTLKLLKDRVLFAGEHLDILVYRKSARKVESITTKGAWLGLVDDISEHLENRELVLETGDRMLIYTDGVTEAMNKVGELYGEARLSACFEIFCQNGGNNEILKGLLNAVSDFQEKQFDDISFLLVHKL